jgi:hypothetical protein
MIKRALVAGFLLWILPAPAYAHAVGPGSGVEIELLLVAGAVLVFGYTLRSSENAKPWLPWVVMIAGAGLVALSFVLPQLTQPRRPSNVSLEIVSPTSGERLPSGRPLKIDVALSGATVARSASDTGKGHLHVYVDNQLQQMPYSTSTTVRLKPGSHRLTVEYVDPQHISYSPPISTSTRVEVVR